MRCYDVRQHLSAYVDEALQPTERDAVEAHLVGCAMCRHALQTLQEMVSALHAAPSPRAPDLVAGVRAKISQQPWWQVLGDRLASLWPAGAPIHAMGMAVAVLLIVVIVGLPRILQPERALKQDQLDLANRALPSKPVAQEERVFRRSSVVAEQPREALEGTIGQFEDNVSADGDFKPELQQLGVPVAAPSLVLGGEVSGGAGARANQQLADKKLAEVGKTRTVKSTVDTTDYSSIEDGLLANASWCEADTDCIVVTEFGCPLACQIAVHKDADLTPLRAYMSASRTRGVVCEPCTSPPIQAACQANRCVIVPDVPSPTQP